MLGEGVYHLREVARYTGLSPSTVHAWFKGRSGGRGPVFGSDYRPIRKDYAVSFLNLIETYVASFFLREGVRPKIIHRSHQILQGELDTPHPFAHADLCTDGKRIIRTTAQVIADPQLSDVISRQMLFSEMHKHLRHIEYNHATQLAQLWAIADGVVINPNIGFGKPVIQASGVTTFVVANQYEANNRNAGIVSRLYQISEHDVHNAVKFESSLNKAA